MPRTEMIYLALYLIFISWLWSDFSIRGRRLELNQHPNFQRLRWFGLGLIVALILSEHPLEDGDWLSWTTVLILALGAVRVPVMEGTILKLRAHRSRDVPS